MLLCGCLLAHHKQSCPSGLKMIPDTYDKLVELRKVELEMSSVWNQYLSDGSGATLDRYNAVLKEFNRLNGSDWKAVTKEPTGEIL